MALPCSEARFEVVIVGAGAWTRDRLLSGQGARRAKHRRVEKGWLGGGNTGRNTTVIRSNYLWEASEGIYGHAHRMWATLSLESIIT